MNEGDSNKVGQSYQANDDKVKGGRPVQRESGPGGMGPAGNGDYDDTLASKDKKLVTVLLVILVCMSTCQKQDN